MDWKLVVAWLEAGHMRVNPLICSCASGTFQPIEMGAVGGESYGDQIYPAQIHLVSIAFFADCSQLSGLEGARGSCKAAGEWVNPLSPPLCC